MNLRMVRAHGGRTHRGREETAPGALPPEHRPGIRRRQALQTA